MIKQSLLIPLFFLACQGLALAETVSFESGPEKVSLFELYTSEGCSSCPPADQWFASLKDSPDLWQRVVPVAFHVDYWNNLGWKDPFSSLEFTLRQRDYAETWKTMNIYTPMIVRDGAEFPGWIQGRLLQEEPRKNTGILRVERSGPAEFTVTFAPPKEMLNRPDWIVNAALLGFGVPSHVTAGENAGRDFRHDFTVLAFARKKSALQEGEVKAAFVLKAQPNVHTAQLGVAAWVQLLEEEEPLQAVGGLLPRETGSRQS